MASSSDGGNAAFEGLEEGLMVLVGIVVEDHKQQNYWSVRTA